jgi:hypothetical protein
MSRTLSLLVAAMLLTACAVESNSPVEPTITASVATTVRDPACVQSSRLIGRISLTTGEGPLEWWGITRRGFIAAGLDPSEFQAKIEGELNREFATLDEAIAALVAQVVPLDGNTNGFVCAYQLRGTKTGFGDPNYTDYFFRVLDDTH